MADAPQLLLDHHLKTLKLPTFLHEYAKQARLSADEGVDHIAYLARLAELELIDRERRLVERRIKQARCPAVKQPSSRARKHALPGNGRASTSRPFPA